MPLAPVFSRLCADLLEEGQRVRFRVHGSSMGPAIRDGDVVTVAPVATEAIRRGDVLLYASERGFTAHRVIGRLRGPEVAFRMRGDAVGSPTEQVAVGRVLGRVEVVQRDGREHPVGGAPSPLARLASRIWRRLLRAAWEEGPKSGQGPGVLRLVLRLRKRNQAGNTLLRRQLITKPRGNDAC